MVTREKVKKCVSIVYFLAVIGLGKAQFPACWVHHGECLDSNVEPLDLSNLDKPEPNTNVAKVIQNVYSFDACLNECEKESPTTCSYFTLYRKDLKKPCLLVGFNLGTSCERLENVCVLHRACKEFNKTCGPACATGRRMIHDMKNEWNTLVAGGLREERDEYEKSVEILNVNGTRCTDTFENFTYLGEGNAAAYDPNSGLVLTCGGFTGEYLTECEEMNPTDGWKNSTAALTTARAFHSMVAAGSLFFAFGGYNDADGSLDSVEKYDAGTWADAGITLPAKRSHMCAVVLNLDGKENIFLLGGWDHEQKYLDTILHYQLNEADGTLTEVPNSWKLPEDKPGESSTAPRSDMACLAYRKDGWNSSILMTGGYRSTGWINTVWLFDVELALAGGELAWTQLKSISEDFTKGRHYHGMGLSMGMPMVIGGWQNAPMASVLMFIDCNREQTFQYGMWKKMKSLKVAREKLVSFPIKKMHLPTAWRC